MLPVHVTGLVVQSQEGHRRVDGFPALGTQPHHLKACLMDLLCELIDSNITGSAHQHWPGGGVTLLIKGLEHSQLSKRKPILSIID